MNKPLTESETMAYIFIKNLETGEILNVSRDVRDSHPEWVHEQMGTSNEVELQNVLSQMNVNDWYDDDGHHLGHDELGLTMFR